MDWDNGPLLVQLCSYDYRIGFFISWVWVRFWTEWFHTNDLLTGRYQIDPFPFW